MDTFGCSTRMHANQRSAKMLQVFKKNSKRKNKLYASWLIGLSMHIRHAHRSLEYTPSRRAGLWFLDGGHYSLQPNVPLTNEIVIIIAYYACKKHRQHINYTQQSTYMSIYVIPAWREKSNRKKKNRFHPLSLFFTCTLSPEAKKIINDKKKRSRK